MGLADYSTNVMYSPDYIGSVFNFFTWLLPLLAIAVLSLEIMRQMSVRSHKKDIMSKRGIAVISTTMTDRTDGATTSTSGVNKALASLKKHSKLSNFRLRPTTKFQIIILSYWFQWIIPCILTVLQPCQCVPNSIYTIFYWLTYTVSSK